VTPSLPSEAATPINQLLLHLQVSSLVKAYLLRSHLQLLQQRLRLLQITRVEAFVPAVNRSERFARLLHLALIAPEACEVHEGAPTFQLLAVGYSQIFLLVFPNLIAVATRRKQVSGFLERSSILPVVHHFGPHFIILPDTVVLSNPGNLGKHSTKRRAHKLL